jgi:predicted nucleotidyltransferase
MNGMQKIRAHRESILAVAKRHGAVRLRVFGSVARSEDRPESDVDFLVQMQDGSDLLDVIDLSQELEELLHQKADVISEEELSPYLKNRILQEAIAI